MVCSNPQVIFSIDINGPDVFTGSNFFAETGSKGSVFKAIHSPAVCPYP